MATQETIKQLFSGGVLRDIEDADARQAITALQNALDALTSGDTTTAIENFQEVIDFLEGVTDDETLIGKITALQTAINGKQPMLTFDNAPTAGSNNPVKSGGVKTALDAKVNTETGKGLSSNDYTTAEKNKLQNLPTNPVTSISVNGQNPKTPVNGNVNIEVQGGGDTVVVNSDGANIVDEHNNNSVLFAPSARQMKLMYQNMMAIFNGLANYAFTNGKPLLDWVGTLTTYAIGLAAEDANVVVTIKDGNNNVVTSPQNEGSSLTIEISTASGYRFASAPTATMGGTSITLTESSGVYSASIGALSGNIVINAAAVEFGSFSVNIPAGAAFCDSSGASANAPRIEEGDNWTGYIKPESGKRWATAPSSTGATVTLHSGSIYKIEATDVQSDISVSGATEDIQTYTVAVSVKDGTRNITVNKASLDNTSSVEGGDTYSGTITVDSGWQIDEVTVLMGANEVSGAFNPQNNTITVNNVSGNISVEILVSSIVKITRSNSVNIYSQPAGSAFDGSPYCYTDYIKLTIKENDSICWHTAVTASRESMSGVCCLGFYDANKKPLYKSGNTEPYGYSNYSMSNGERVFTIPAAMITALKAANGVSDSEVDVYVRASMKLTNGDIDTGSYLSQTRGGTEIFRYSSATGLSEANDTTHSVIIKHIKSDNTETVITNKKVAYSGTELNLTHTNAAMIDKFFDGHTLNLQLTAKSGYTRSSVVVMMGDVDVTSTAFNANNGMLSLAVTDDVVITVTTVANT